MEIISNEFAESVYAAGYALFTNGEYDDAKNIFVKLVVCKPNVSHYWRALGAFYQKTKDYTSAIAAYTGAITKDDTDVVSYVYRGECYILNGNINCGLKELENVLNFRSVDTNVVAWVERAKSLIKIHKDTESNTIEREHNDRNIPSECNNASSSINGINTHNLLSKNSDDRFDDMQDKKGTDDNSNDNLSNTLENVSLKDDIMNEIFSNDYNGMQENEETDDNIILNLLNTLENVSLKDDIMNEIYSHDSGDMQEESMPSESITDNIGLRYCNVQSFFDPILELSMKISDTVIDPTTNQLIRIGNAVDHTLQRMLSNILSHANKIVLCENDNDDKVKHVIITDYTNMIIEGNNRTNVGLFNEYVAISHVSNGSRKENLEFIISGQRVNTRYSNDRLKYLAVMQYVDMKYKGTKIWTDYISMSKNYKSSLERMTTIGNAYKIASKTIVPLDSIDAGILIFLMLTALELSMYVNICSIAKVYSPETAVRRYVIETNNIELDSIRLDVIEKIGERTSMLNNMVGLFLNKNEFSYWSRIWTMQEQLMSNSILYGTIIEGEFVRLASSDDICQLLYYLYPLKALLSKAILIEDNSKTRKATESKYLVENISRQLWSLLPGIERVAFALFADKSGIMTFEDAVITELCESVKCSRNKNEFNEAVGILLGIEARSYKELWQKIVKKVASNGYLPEKKLYGKKHGHGWWPEGVTKKYRNNEYANMYYSVVFTQFTKITQSGKNIMLSKDNSVTLKLPLLRVRIECITEQNTPYNMYVFSNMKLVKNKNKLKFEASGILQIYNKDCNISMTIIADQQYFPGDELNVMFYSTNRIYILSQTSNSITGNAKIKFNDIASELLCRTADSQYYAVLKCK